MSLTKIIQRTEKHVIKPSNRYYNMICDYCHVSKDLYNQALYLSRQYYFNSPEDDKKFLWYNDLDKITKHQEVEFNCYHQMPSAQSAQQTLTYVDRTIKSFCALCRKYREDKSSVSGRPRIPKYKPKHGVYILEFTYQEARLKNDIIKFPKKMNGFTIKPKCIELEGFQSICVVRFIPQSNKITCEVVYKIKVPDMLPYNGRTIGIDIGLKNIVTVGNNFNGAAFAINGDPLKSQNKYYNKKVAKMKSCSKRMNNKYSTNRIQNFTAKHQLKMNDYLHKVSKYVIDYCIANDVTQIIIGKNKEWKQNCNIGKVNNQTFVQLPFARLIGMITYKAENHGITVQCIEESYTSGTSFIDNEDPVKENYNKNRRVHRGLFISSQGIPINADLNAAYQIMKKVIPIKWDIGCVLHPLKVAV